MYKMVIFFLLVGYKAVGQQLFNGKIVDAETGKPVAFASVSIVGTAKGTSSNHEGEFTLSIQGPVSMKITSVGYESVVVNSKDSNHLIALKSSITQLEAVYVFNKSIDPEKIVRKAFANVSKNFVSQSFLQKFFYRHYCKDDSAYGRLIEAFVDVWKKDGYHFTRKLSGDKEGVRITQLRRSLDKTTMSQGHEPISLANILQADVVGYQTPTKSQHLSFYTDVNNLKTDINDYTFSFDGVTSYDGDDVYKISYKYKSDSVLTTSGKYVTLTQITGVLFITVNGLAFVKTEEEKRYEKSIIHTSAFYRKYSNLYYAYHFLREGKNYISNGKVHSFHIDLMSVETRTGANEKFTGTALGKEQLTAVPYDSVFWNNNSILKTTPLEDKIITDLGDGESLDKQFSLYKQYEENLTDGGTNANEKFNWFREHNLGKRNLYLIFWSSDCKSYLADLEFAKRLQQKYRNRIAFVLLSLDDDEALWQQTVSKFTLFSDGIVNYRIGSNSKIVQSFKINRAPAFVLITSNGELDSNPKRPSDALLEDDFKLIIER